MWVIQGAAVVAVQVFDVTPLVLIFADDLAKRPVPRLPPQRLNEVGPQFVKELSKGEQVFAIAA